MNMNPPGTHLSNDVGRGGKEQVWAGQTFMEKKKKEVDPGGHTTLERSIVGTGCERGLT